jgi:hypothetical protein
MTKRSYWWWVGYIVTGLFASFCTNVYFDSKLHGVDLSIVDIMAVMVASLFYLDVMRGGK